MACGRCLRRGERSRAEVVTARWLRYSAGVSHPLLQDAFVAAEVERALDGFDAWLSEDDRRWLRDQLACALEEDPQLSALLQGAHPRAQIDRSGELARFDVVVDDEDHAAGGS